MIYIDVVAKSMIFGNEFTYDKNHNKNTININPSTRHYRENSNYQKNFMTIKFDGGDRIRVNRHAQYCGSTYSNIYVRFIYLDYESESKMIGMV